MNTRFIRAILFGTLLVPLVYAQTDAARIQGTVTDASGAVLSGATVTVQNEKTGESRQFKSDNRGVFIATQLQPAIYTVTADANGMAQAAIKGISIQVGQERVVNLSLQPSTMTTEVTVDGGGLAMVDTSSARVGANVDERAVASLPLNGRQVSQLYLLAPGAVNNGSGTFDNIRFSGAANQENIIRFDGVEGSNIVDASPGNLNGETTSLFRLEQSLENVQEFRIDSSNYPAEYGTGTGGQISFITKSGSNNLHGSLFEYLRNDDFDARNFFDKSTKSKLRLNQFGGSVGGPIKKDRLFFFLSYEGLRQNTSSPIVESTLSAAARAKAVPSIQPLLAAFPVGQTPSSDSNLDIVNVNAPATLSENSGGARLDYNINDKLRLFVRYFRDQGQSSQTQNSTGSIYATSIVPQNAVVSLNQVFTPAMINETKFGFNGAKTRVQGIPGPSPNADINGVTINLSGSVALGGIAGQTGSAGVAIPSGLIRLSSSFNGRGAPYTDYSTSYIDNLSVLHGSHSMKFGAELRAITLYNDQLGGTTYSFSNVDSFLANQPSSIAFNGDLSAKSPFTGLSGVAHMRQNYYTLYAQDEWKITPTFTMSYGLRWEYYQPLHETRNKDVWFSMAQGTIFPGYSQEWYHSSTHNFGPRLAFAWSPSRFNNKTVFRIGSGFYYGPGQTEDQLQPEANDRIGKTITSGPLLAYPLDINQIFSSYDINDPNLGFQPRAYAPGYTIPERILQYTASVQQELPGRTVLTVAYVGNQGRNLFLRSITNKIVSLDMNPTTGAAIVNREFGNRFAEIDYKTSGGRDYYSSMQVTLNRQFNSGLSLGLQYTWGHSIGNSGGSNEANTAGNPYDFNADHGSNNFDVRQSFNMTALYELPFGKGKRYLQNASGFENALFSGWQLGGVMNARTGVPVDILITRPDYVYQDKRDGKIYANPVVVGGQVMTIPVINTPGGGNSRNVRRPDVVAGVDPYLRNGLNWINPAAFAVPLPGTFGNSSRNSLTGPGLSQLDLTLSKKFPVGESKNIEFRAEIYNLLNHANFTNPGNLRLQQIIPSAPGASGLQPGQAFTPATAGGNFGVLNSTVSNQIGIGTNRQLQLALRFNF
ncbi:MAG TPA: TonB-dependent receptor [Bryobacteraceae bacterium]|nr:TonB-dependent receptor [Bryobacteraceae bacterium]